jgi:branched-chain amino acid aminotransferase
MVVARRWVWIGGEAEPVAPEEARLSALDHAYLYGSGLYETLRTYHARPFALAEHLERLRFGAERVGFGPLPLGEMGRTLRELAARRAHEESYLRLTASPGLQFPGWHTSLEGPVRWAAYAGPLAPHVAATYERGVRCVLGSRPRWNPGGFIPAVKFAANPEFGIMRQEGAAKGAFEVLLVNERGLLAEGSSSNVFLVKERALVTPDLGSGILDGVTRHVLLGLCKKAGIGAEERPVRPEEIWEAEELFVASTLKEVVPVVEVEGRPIGGGTPGVITDRLLGLFQEYALETTQGEPT